MRQQISPKLIFAVVIVAILVIAGIGMYVWKQPSVTADPSVKVDASGQPIASPRFGGGPTAEDLKKRDEFYKQHPEMVGK
jgi:hypothetical protein